eukprot:GHVR01149120.1.p2 GENE.GHVR01149120.1~~GHVR01149120.1.p2  ORF type:complete len:186 (-),score=9.16 GHVR01149120.1:846-1403(-)
MTPRQLKVPFAGMELKCSLYGAKVFREGSIPTLLPMILNLSASFKSQTIRRRDLLRVAGFPVMGAYGDHEPHINDLVGKPARDIGYDLPIHTRFLISSSILISLKINGATHSVNMYVPPEAILTLTKGEFSSLKNPRYTQPYALTEFYKGVRSNLYHLRKLTPKMFIVKVTTTTTTRILLYKRPS